MKTLQTSRVLIIDDANEEAMPLIQALGRLGIGCIHMTGLKSEELPRKPYSGIRLAFIDMDLDVGGDVRTIIAKTINVFKHSVAEESSPCVIVAWTKHDDYIEYFAEAVKKEMPRFLPCIVTKMAKPADASKLKVLRIMAQVRRTLKDHWPANVLWAWEQAAHSAATATTTIATDIANNEVAEELTAKPELDPVKAWKISLKSALRALTEASGGQSVARNDVAAHLIETLNSVHLDALERSTSYFDDCDMQKLLTRSRLGLSASRKRALNTKLLLAGPSTYPTMPKPGNVYIAECNRSIVRPFPGVKVLPAEIIKDCVPREYKKKTEEIVRLQNNSKSSKTTKKEIREAKRDAEKLLREAQKSCKCVLVEITPTCDVAQRKSRVFFFIGGILSPNRKPSIFENGREKFLWRLNELEVDSLDGTWHLLLNAHFLFVRAIGLRVHKTRAAFRLRQGVTSDVQHWLSGHLSRPGILKVD